MVINWRQQSWLMTTQSPKNLFGADRISHLEKGAGEPSIDICESGSTVKAEPPSTHTSVPSLQPFWAEVMPEL